MRGIAIASRRCMDKLARQNKDKVIDLLTARLLFERTGVKLYDSIMAKLRAKNETGYDRMLGVARGRRR